MINFYHRFLPSAARLLQSLYTATSGRHKTLEFTKKMTLAFNSAKAALANVTMLIHPRRKVPLSLTVDASDQAVRAVLQQLVHSTWQPLWFFNKQLHPPEKKYSTFDRELL